MVDAYQSIGASAWLADDHRSFALRQAVGSVGLQPSHTAPTIVSLGDGATRRDVTDRQCNLDFDTLYWRPGDDDLFTWLEATDYVRFLVELVNGAAFCVEGPRSTFTVTAPTDDLIQVTGTIENGNEDWIALVGGRIATYPALDPTDFGTDAVAYANFDWSAAIYAATVVDSIDHAGGGGAAAINASFSNLRTPSGQARRNEDVTIFQGVDLARTEQGAGVQVVSFVPDGLGQVAGRRGTFTPSFNAGLTSATGRTYAMQEMGAATRD